MKSWERGLAVGVTLAILAVFLWVVPIMQGAQWNIPIAKDRALFVNEARRTLAQVIGGGFLIVGLYVGWRRLLAAEETNRIGRESLVADSFTRAVEQLGHAKASVRIGGIYSLARVASTSRSDCLRVIDILQQRIVRQRSIEGIDRPHKHTFTDEVRVAIRQCAELAESISVGCKFTRVDLSGADFRRAKLTDWSFEECILESVKFDEAVLTGVQLRQVAAVNASFWRSQLKDCAFRGVFVDSTFSEIHAAGSSFRGNFFGATFMKADFLRCTLSGANGLIEDFFTDVVFLETERPTLQPGPQSPLDALKKE